MTPSFSDFGSIIIFRETGVHKNFRLWSGLRSVHTSNFCIVFRLCAHTSLEVTWGASHSTVNRCFQLKSGNNVNVTTCDTTFVSWLTEEGNAKWEAVNYNNGSRLSISISIALISFYFYWPIRVWVSTYKCVLQLLLDRNGMDSNTQ